MKVYELAKDLKLKSVELLDVLRKKHNMSIKNHMQNLTTEDVEKIRIFFDKKSKALSVVSTKKSVSATVRKQIKKQAPLTLQTAESPVRSKIIRRRVQDKKTVPPPSSLAKDKNQAPSPPVEEQTASGEGARSLTSHNIRPGLVTDESQDILKKIGSGLTDPLEEKKKPKKTLEKENQNQRFRATDFRKREVIFQPKKRRLSTGLSVRKTQITTPKSHKRLIKIYDNSISIEEIAQKMGVKTRDLLKKIKQESLFSDSDIPSLFDCESAEVVASLFGWEVKNMVRKKDDIIRSLSFGDLSAEKQNKAPVVTVMGHVNHGKTTLLDYIRKSRVAVQEAGGITQHIGAYSVPVGKSFVTFIDTPGHSAFTAMRARGAKVTDIVVIVVSADDGVQPQTVEAVNHAKSAKAPVIVAVNKVDLPASDVEKTKKQMMEHDLVPEEWGGDTVFCSVSALKGEGVGELLEHIQLVAEMHELKANPHRSALGVVIESRLEKGRGLVMTLLVQDGTLESGQVLIADNQVGRVRQMTDDMGRRVSSAVPGQAVEVSGFNHFVQVGETFYVVKNEKSARKLLLERKKEKEERKEKLSVEELLFKAHTNTVKTLNIILKTDVAGSQEALTWSIEKLNTDKVQAKIIHAGPGRLSESDVLLAVTAGAKILCFNVGVDTKAQQIIKKQSLFVKTYTVIYDLLKDVEKMMAQLLDPEITESFGGRAEVQQIFPISHVGVVAGCKTIKGKIANHHLIRLIRDDSVIYTGKISSLKRFKQSVKEVSEGQECGIGLGAYKETKPGDIIESFTQTEIKRETL